jgi:DNA-binding transcriptional MerR regulator
VAKGPQAFRSISEAADELGVPQHVLRFWETRFSFIRPMKRAGGRRFYRPYDIAILRQIQRLLHEEGYTIKGVQKLQREQGLKRFMAADAAANAPPGPADDAFVAPAADSNLPNEARQRLAGALQDLQAAKARLDELLGHG